MWGLPIDVEYHLLICELLVGVVEPTADVGECLLMWVDSMLIWGDCPLMLGGPPGVVEKQPVDVGGPAVYVRGITY